MFKLPDFNLLVELSLKSPELTEQFKNLVLWFALLTLVFMPIVIFFVLPLFHVILYYTVSWYRIRQNKGLAIYNVMCRFRDKNKWTDTMRLMVEDEYKVVQSKNSLSTIAVCLGGWDVKNKTE